MRGKYKIAFGEFRPLAKRGDADAQFNIGQCTPEDMAFLKIWRQRMWYTLAARQEGSAAYNLGVIYRTGKGVPKDTKTAWKWYNAAARQGDPASALH